MAKKKTLMSMDIKKYNGTNKSKPKVNIKKDPIERAWAGGGEGVHKAISQLQDEKGSSDIKMGELADRVEKNKSKKEYRNGGKIEPEKKATKKSVKKRNPDEFTDTYNAATGRDNDPYYDPKKAESYKKNAIAKYGSLKASREANKYEEGGKIKVKKKETPEEKMKRIAAEKAAKKKENEKKAAERAETKKSKEEQVATQKETTKELNKNLKGALESYRETGRSEDSTIELKEAKNMKSEGSYFAGAVVGESDPKKREKQRRKRGIRINKKK